MLAVLMALILGSDPDFAGAFTSGVRVDGEAAQEQPFVESPAEPPETDDHEPVTVQIPFLGPKVMGLPKLDKPQKPLAWVAGVDRPDRPKEQPTKGPRPHQFHAPGIWFERPPKASGPRRNLVLLLPDGDPCCWKSPGVMTDHASQFAKSNDVYAVKVEHKAYEKPESYPAMWEPEAQCYHYGAAMRSWDTLVASINESFVETGKSELKVGKPKGFLRGGIPRELVQPYLDYFRDNPNGSIRVDNRDEDNRPKVWKVVSGMFEGLLQPGSEFTWGTEDGVTSVVCVVPVPVGLELVKRQMSGVVFTPETVTLQLVMCPDYVLEIE